MAVGDVITGATLSATTPLVKLGQHDIPVRLTRNTSTAGQSVTQDLAAENASGTEVVYAQLLGTVLANTAGAHNGGLEVWVAVAGTMTRVGCLRTGGLVLGALNFTNSSCGLELSSTTRAFMPPRMTSAQRDALTALDGMVIYNSTDGRLECREAGAWADL